MALEPIGESFAVEKLKATLRKKYPNHNFDVPAPPDRTHKAPYLCKDNKIKYIDLEGNLYCGNRYKLQDENNAYKWEWAVCHALIESVDEQKNKKEQQEEMF